MAKLFVCLYLFFFFISSCGKAQKNEISTFVGFISPLDNIVIPNDVYQLGFERNVNNKLSIYMGLRYQNLLEPNQNEYQVDNGPIGTSKFIQESYNSKKIDMTFFFIPINKSRFKLKTGLGPDFGRTLYAFAHEGVTKIGLTPNGYESKYFTQYQIEKLTDFGIHYVIEPVLYFKNNLFLASQIMFNPVFKEETDFNFIQKSTLNLSIGVGFTF